MSKKQKKRNKPYTGEDAATQRPTIHRYQAVVRSPLAEWWNDHKRTARISAIAGGIGLAIIFIVYELIILVF